MDFRRNIKEFITAINEHVSADPQMPAPRGFDVMGWFKPSKVDSDDFANIHEHHIINIVPPLIPLRGAIQQLRFPRPPAA